MTKLNYRKAFPLPRPPNLDTDLTHFIKVNTKRIIDLSIKHTTLRLLVDNIRKKPR